jgi:hypothetical protein
MPPLVDLIGDRRGISLTWKRFRKALLTPSSTGADAGDRPAGGKKATATSKDKSCDYRLLSKIKMIMKISFLHTWREVAFQY